MIDGLTDGEKCQLQLVGYSINWNEHVGVWYIHSILSDGSPQIGITSHRAFHTPREAFNYLMEAIMDGKA